MDPAGFQDIVAAKPVLSAGAYLLLAVGIALSLLGFLGCCGALRRSRPLLLGVSEGGTRDGGAGRAGGCGVWEMAGKSAGGGGVSPEQPGARRSPPQPRQLPTPPQSSPHLVSLSL